MLSSPEFWVAVSFVLFVALVIYLKVPGAVLAMLDARADRIRAELDEARRLREEAQGVLAGYKRDQQKAQEEAQAIITRAQEDARLMKERAEADLEDKIKRRMKAVEDKIAQAEADAVREVRETAANRAIAAARTVIGQKMSAKTQASLVDDAISALKDGMH